MEIKELIGGKVLTGIDRFTDSRPSYEGSDYNEDCEVCRVILDGVTYEFVEDPNDGYRSDCRDPVITTEPVKNSFPGVRVTCVHVDKGDYDAANILRVINAETGVTILDVGTDDIDDYYPSFICNFDAAAVGVAVEQS